MTRSRQDEPVWSRRCWYISEMEQVRQRYHGIDVSSIGLRQLKRRASGSRPEVSCLLDRRDELEWRKNASDGPILRTKCQSKVHMEGKQAEQPWQLSAPYCLSTGAS